MAEYSDAGRGWLPEEYLDEVTPPTRPTPMDWIETVDGKQYWLQKAWPTDEGQPRELSNGDVVPFYWCDSYGTVLLRVQRSGTWSLPAGFALPPEADHFWPQGMPDALASTIEALAAELSTLIEDGQSGAYFEVVMARWATQAVPHMLVIDGTGARFKQVQAN